MRKKAFKERNVRRPQRSYRFLVGLLGAPYMQLFAFFRTFRRGRLNSPTATNFTKSPIIQHQPANSAETNVTSKSVANFSQLISLNPGRLTCITLKPIIHPQKRSRLISIRPFPLNMTAMLQHRLHHYQIPSHHCLPTCLLPKAGLPSHPFRPIILVNYKAN